MNDGFNDRTVDTAMISAPKTLPAAATVAQVRDEFQDDHVHCVLIVKDDVLLTVVERPDLVKVSPEEKAVTLGRLGGRTIKADENLERARTSMLSQGRRRLAVIDDHAALLGLLCLKRTGLGFCSDAGVRARAAEREGRSRVAE